MSLLGCPQTNKYVAWSVEHPSGQRSGLSLICIKAAHIDCLKMYFSDIFLLRLQSELQVLSSQEGSQAEHHHQAQSVCFCMHDRSHFFSPFHFFQIIFCVVVMTTSMTDYLKVGFGIFYMISAIYGNGLSIETKRVRSWLEG